MVVQHQISAHLQRSKGYPAQTNRAEKIRLYKQELQGIEPTAHAITPEQREIQQLKLPKGGYGDVSHAVRDINQWINGYHNVYRPHTNNGGLSACMKKSGNRLFRCPDFVIHYNIK